MKLKIKATLFLFALGLGCSLANADPNCHNRCDLKYQACLAKQPGSLQCKDDWYQCRSDCSNHN